jgi:hypothetical protein
MAAGQTLKAQHTDIGTYQEIKVCRFYLRAVFIMDGM